MKFKLNVFKTNWINLLGIFLAVYLSYIAITLAEMQHDLFTSLKIAFLGSVFGIILYGAMFWIGFLVLMFILDMLLMNKQMKNVNSRLLLQWLIISIPFVYWLVKYSEWIFLVAVLAFLITQYIRKEKILKILSAAN